MKNSMIQAINAISSNEEMNEVIDLIKMKQKQLRNIKARNVKASIQVGDTVKVDGRNGLRIGTVEKIKVKKAIVMIDGRLWDCPLTILEAA
jgi:uncharacterized protein YkvS|tara:strand:- start:67 stop:339 length:273 start_codon:yes stop_codon:yes gene_type:complete